MIPIPLNDFGMTFRLKIVQYLSSIAGGLLLAFETSIVFLVPCFIAILLDVITAYSLGRRVHRKYPNQSDGKFKSVHKFQIIYTMIIIFMCIMLASYVDELVIKGDDGFAVRFVVGVFLFYETWSCLENWSSENDNKIAKALQRIMVNKAERHLDVPLSDILMPDDKRPPHGHHQGGAGHIDNNNVNSEDHEQD